MKKLISFAAIKVTARNKVIFPITLYKIIAIANIKHKITASLAKVPGLP